MLASQGAVQLDRSWSQCANKNGSTDLLARMSSFAITMHFRQGQQVNRDTELAGYWYRVLSGAARQCVVQPEGHRRIVDFLLQGDMCDPAWNDRDSIIEAACAGTTVNVYPRHEIESLAEFDAGFGRELRELDLATAYRLQRQILILGRGPAPRRVCAFLLDMAERSSNGRTNRVLLPMSRYDIADYLALSVETVSRCLTNLRLRKAILFINRRELKILDRAALEYA